MSKIYNQFKSLYNIEAVEEISPESAANYTGGKGYLNGKDPDVILHKDPNAKGLTLNVNAAVNDGVSNIGFTNGDGSGLPTAFNDQTSSITIKRGVWQAFDGTNFRGDTTGSLKPGTYKLGHMNDKISSLKRIA